jgi:hypothetical protein
VQKEKRLKAVGCSRCHIVRFKASGSLVLLALRMMIDSKREQDELFVLKIQAVFTLKKFRPVVRLKDVFFVYFAQSRLQLAVERGLLEN